MLSLACLVLVKVFLIGFRERWFRNVSVILESPSRGCTWPGVLNTGVKGHLKLRRTTAGTAFQADGAAVWLASGEASLALCLPLHRPFGCPPCLIFPPHLPHFQPITCPLHNCVWLSLVIQRREMSENDKVWKVTTQVEATQVSIDRWMDKQNMISRCGEILLSLKKEGNSDTYSMSETWKHYAKWNKPVTKGQILYDSTYMRYLT